MTPKIYTTLCKSSSTHSSEMSSMSSYDSRSPEAEAGRQAEKGRETIISRFRDIPTQNDDYFHIDKYVSKSLS